MAVNEWLNPFNSYWHKSSAIASKLCTNIVHRHANRTEPDLQGYCGLVLAILDGGYTCHGKFMHACFVFLSPPGDYVLHRVRACVRPSVRACVRSACYQLISGTVSPIAVELCTHTPWIAILNLCPTCLTKPSSSATKLVHSISTVMCSTWDRLVFHITS